MSTSLRVPLLPSKLYCMKQGQELLSHVTQLDKKKVSCRERNNLEEQGAERVWKNLLSDPHYKHVITVQLYKKGRKKTEIT